jgi:hypothetical protein
MNYSTRDPKVINRDPVPTGKWVGLINGEKPPARFLSRDFVVKSVLKIFDEVESQKRWGAVSVSFQAGAFRTIKKEETITEEK